MDTIMLIIAIGVGALTGYKYGTNKERKYGQMIVGNIIQSVVDKYGIKALKEIKTTRKEDDNTQK